ANLTFTNAMRVANTGATFFSGNEDWYQYRIKATVSGNQMNDFTYVFFHPDATPGFDPAMDVNKMTGPVTHPMLFTMSGIERMAYNGLPLLTEPIVVDMRFFPGTAGNYTLNFESLETMPGTSMIYLEDKKTGIWTNLRQNSSYSFTAALADNIQRFALHFEPPMSFNTVNEDCGQQNGAISIINPSNETWHLSMDNGMDGIINSGAHMIANLPAGNYNLTLSNQGFSTQEQLSIEANEMPEVNYALLNNGTIYTYDVITAQVTNPDPQTTYRWTLNGLHAGTGSEVSFMVSDPGTYSLRLDAVNGDCKTNTTSQFTVENATTTQVGDMHANMDVRAFPNPANEVLNIVWNHKVDVERIMVSDLAGRIVMDMLPAGRMQGNQLQLDTRALPEGIYLINLMGETNRVLRVSVAK
ncbi:MAG: T9SS type A sorting domain-containing protein, partial [Flavobacteriales bacterium]